MKSYREGNLWFFRYSMSSHGKQNIPIKPMGALTETSSKSSNHNDSEISNCQG